MSPLSSGENSTPDYYPHAHPRKPEPPIISELASYHRGRWEVGQVNTLSLIVLSVLGGTILVSCAPTIAEAIATPHPDSSPTTGAGEGLPTADAIVSLDSPENIERLFTPTPDAMVAQPTAISPAEIGNYVDSQPRILDEYVVIPPTDLIPELDGDSISQESADNLKRMAFVPVSAGGYDYLTAEEGTAGMIPLPNMSTEDGDVLTLDPDASAKGDWFVYVGKDAGGQEIMRYSPKSVACDGECATAIWFGKGDNAGTTLIFDMDPDTGEIKGMAQAFYTDTDDKVVFEKFDPSEWSTDITGADAIVFAIDNGAQMTYDPDSDTVSYTVSDIGEDGKVISKVIWAEVEDYHYIGGFGTYVDIAGEDGDVHRYVEIDGDFVKSEKMESPSEAPVYKLGQRVFIERDGLVEWVDKLSVDEKNGDVSIISDNQEWKWDGSEWVEVGFDLDEWVGDDSERQEFAKIIGQIGYPVENITCDDEGVCKTLEGSTIWSDGEFTAAFANSAVKEYGDAKATPYGYKTGNVRPGAKIPSDDAEKEVIRPLFLRAQEFLKIQNGGEELLKNGSSSYRPTMIDEEGKSWAVEIKVDRNDPNADKYYVYEKESGELVVIPIK